MARYGLEGEKSTCFFCKMNKNMRRKAQFDTLLVKEKDKNGNENEKTVMDQKSISGR